MTLGPPQGGSGSSPIEPVPAGMPIVDARVRVDHPCPYGDLSRRFPASLLLLWCDNRRDTMLLSCPDGEELERLATALRREHRARIALLAPPEALAELPDFEWKSPPSVTGLARRGGVWVLPPVVYSDGRETYRLIAPTRARLNALIHRLRRLGEVEILSVADRAGLGTVRDYPTASVHFFEGLTSRQTRALIAAHDAGLLEVPARGRWETVANAEGLSRSTFGEHLRKAQLRLLRNSYALLRARSASVERGPVVLPALRSGRRPPRRKD
jgi:predicted DNA binding protein